MPLDGAAARRFYDRLGRFQDTQRFYEDPAVRRLVDLATFGQSRAVFELGCGTGRLAADLLDSVLPTTARYLVVDVSPTMVRLASRRLSRWAGRATVQLLEPPALALPGDAATFDRFVAAYLFDLLSPADTAALLAEAARLLAPGGLLALVSLADGTTAASRMVCSAWNAVALRWPWLVGGCRTIDTARRRCRPPVDPPALGSGRPLRSALGNTDRCAGRFYGHRGGLSQHPLKVPVIPGVEACISTNEVGVNEPRT